ncbi:MAG: hypothetical protein AAFQ42_10370 [Pseudomonadota bacterium]
MTACAKMTSVVLFCMLLAWVGSYVSYRALNTTVDETGTRSLAFPQSMPVLADVFAPLADVDRHLTGVITTTR